MQLDFVTPAAGMQGKYEPAKLRQKDHSPHTACSRPVESAAYLKLRQTVGNLLSATLLLQPLLSEAGPAVLKLQVSLASW
jgi:hypothetical protein